MPTLEVARVRSWRAANQFLARGARADGIADVLDRVVAVQSQDLAASAIGLWTRSPGLAPGAARSAVGAAGILRRGWFLRGTLHHVLAADAGWLLRLFGPAGAETSRRRCAQLGVDGPLLARAGSAAAAAVAEGPLTRAELTQRLAALGVPASGQAPFHVLRHAALRGLLRHGPVRHDEPTFVPADADPSGPDGDDAVSELARRYVRGHGPAAAEDFAVWSGLPLTAARRAWSGLRDVVRVTWDGGAGVLPAERADALAALPDVDDVRLLPAYDGYLLAHHGRGLVVADAAAHRVRPGGGVLRPCVLVDGGVVGTWTRTPDVRVEAFHPLGPAVAAAVRAEAEGLRRQLAG